MKNAILAIDEGTTGTTVLIIDQCGEIIGKAYAEFKQYYPHPGWVEHDANEIWEKTQQVIREAKTQCGIRDNEIAAIGITNQRETTVIWDRESGQPVHRAIVWQCRRTSDICSQLQRDGLEPLFQKKTGLVVDAYFSATKIKWLLDNVPGAREKVSQGKLLFGTIDSWLLWKLTGGQTHATDFTNAARTLIFNIHEKKWDPDLLDLLHIPANILPDVKPSSGEFGITRVPNLFSAEIPITGIAGDQQAALFGQNCWQPGMVKNTFGTGCFLVMNTGDSPIHSQNKLLTTLACNAETAPCYALEGSVFIAGAVVQWLRDELGIINSASETEAIATSVPDNNGVYFVPAFVGLGAPHWDQSARGMITGLTRGSNRAHIVRAALESIAFRNYDILDAMIRDAKQPVTKIQVDGGAAANNFLMQFQADILQLPIERPVHVETTALGAAFLAGRATGFWKSAAEIAAIRRIDRTFEPALPLSERNRLVDGWRDAIKRTLNN